MSKMLCHLLVLVFLTSRATTLGKPTDSVLDCGEDRSCAILMQLMSKVDKLNERLEELKTDLNKSLVSTATISTQLNEKLDKGLEELNTDLNNSLATISTQLGRHSTDLQSLDGRLKAHEVSQGKEYQLVQSELTRRLGDLFIA